MRYLNINKAIEAWNGIQPLSERDRERLSRKFTVDFNFNSNHIEGNTLTYGQTELLLLFGKVYSLSRGAPSPLGYFCKCRFLSY